MKQLQRLIEILGISEDEAMRAILSAFASVQPGSMRQGLLRSKDYGEAPELRVIWDLLTESAFKCTECGTHYDITIDHIDGNRNKNDKSSLRIVCRDCNRAANSRGLENRNANLRIYKALISLWEKGGKFPSNVDIQKLAGVSQISGSYYMIRFFEAKLTGKSTPLRAYGRAEVSPLARKPEKLRTLK